MIVMTTPVMMMRMMIRLQWYEDNNKADDGHDFISDVKYVSTNLLLRSIKQATIPECFVARGVLFYVITRAWRKTNLPTKVF
jgi:hypothetical protein